MSKEKILKTKSTAQVEASLGRTVDKKYKAASEIWDSFKKNLKSSSLLALGGVAAIASHGQEKNVDKQADQIWAADGTKKIENVQTKKNVGRVIDTINYYSEAINDPEYKNTAGSLKEIIDQYKEGTVNAYEVHTTNTKFGKLRNGKYKNFTEEASIKYKNEELKINIFKKGSWQELKNYYKDIGFKEDSVVTQLVDQNENPVQSLKLSEINESAYEEVVNLHRTQFIKGAVWGQNPEHTRWAFLNGEEGTNGVPVVVLHVNIDGKDTKWLVALVKCQGNNITDFLDASCVDISTHNKSVRGD